MERQECLELRELALATAHLMRRDAEWAKDFAERTQVFGGLGTAEPRPRIATPLYTRVVQELETRGVLTTGTLSRTSVLTGKFNNILYADRLAGELLAGGLGPQQEQEKARLMAEAMEHAADALVDVAAAGYCDCVLGIRR